MKHLLTLLFIINIASAEKLIYLSDDLSAENLDSLSSKYQQPLLISQQTVYLVPSQCRLDRFFGGASQGTLILTAQPDLTYELPVTQSVFEAKEKVQIQKSIEVEKSIALLEGKQPKAFLDDKEGRGFGGASQGKLSFSKQRFEAVSTKPNTADKQKVVTDTKNVRLPYCQILENGSGYSLHNVHDATLYDKAKQFTIINDKVLFK